MNRLHPFSAWLLLLLLCVWVSGCSKSPENATNSGSTPNSRTSSTTAAPADPEPPSESLLPQQGGVAGYVGSDSCRDCHQDQHASWHRSFHRTMTQIPVVGAVQADFHNVVLTNDNTRFTLRQSSNQFRIHMEHIAPSSPGAPMPEPVEIELGLVTGSHHMQVFWIPAGQGNAQLGFPFTWLIPEKRWVPRNATFIRPPDFVHRPEMWNTVCSRCHSTGPEPRLDSVARTVDTHVGEFGIACEACHGPGEKHVQARSLAGKLDKPSPEVLLAEIVHPGKLPPQRSAQVCGFCHSMKWIGNTEPWTKQGFTYRPGADLEATTPIIRGVETNRPPTLAEFLRKNPDILTDFFWPDGMMRVSGREYNGLIESPCHKGGQFSCISCHSIHESDPDDQLARNRTDARACTQCHEKFRDTSTLTAHTHHLAASSGSDCYNCHMPHTTYGVLKAIRSHQISNPNIQTDLGAGRPNACNLCHLDRSLEWSATHLQSWYKQPLPELSTDQKQLPESVRLAWSGDAGQRALIAWHFSWEPALAVSGRDWVPAALAPLLSDEYAAVRCVAGRSLSHWPEEFPTGYDFTQEFAAQQAHATKVLTTWRSRGKPDAGFPALFSKQPADPLESEIQRLRASRDHRPMRLRE